MSFLKNILAAAAAIFCLTSIFSVHAQSRAVKQVEQPKIENKNGSEVHNFMPPTAVQAQNQAVPAVSGAWLYKRCLSAGENVDTFFVLMNNELVQPRGWDPVSFKMSTIGNQNCVLVLFKRKY